MSSKSSDSYNKTSTKIVELVTLCVTENKARNVELMDGSLVRLSVASAKRFINTHDKLAESSKDSFRLMLIESKKTFETVLEFCKNKEI